MTQGYVSKLERQDDMLVSKLYAYVEALGGEVEIRARFPNEQEVQINQFEEIEKLKAVLAPKTKKPKKQLVREAGAGAWVEQFQDRYLAFEKVSAESLASS